VLGREAAALLPFDALAGSSLRPPWSWRAAAIGRALEAVEPVMARDGRVIQLVDGGHEAIVAAVMGVERRLSAAQCAPVRPDEDTAAIVELLPPGGLLPPGPRTRANVGLEPVPGGAGDPDVVPAAGLFAPPERFDQRSFSAVDAARTVTETAVETLRARGEPARYERLLGEILVGLDRAGQLRRLVAATLQADPVLGSGDEPGSAGPGSDAAPADGSAPDTEPPRSATTSAGPGASSGQPPGTAARPRRAAPERDANPDPVERLLALIRDELGRPTQRRLAEIEPGRWWLADRRPRRHGGAPRGPCRVG
jgi:hypothetical protein